MSSYNSDICTTCPIARSCQHKYPNPKRCPHKPAPIGINISEGIANMGRKRIAFVGRDYDMGRVQNDEHRIRMGICEGWE